MDVVEEQLASVHGEMTMVKGDLQRLGSLEAKMEVMLEKMMFLERMERMERMERLLQKCECSGKAAAPEIGDNRRIEILSRRLKMPVFEGWNPEGWIFQVKRYFNVNRLIETEKTSNNSD